jgi:1,5-anhydro-D-fructose reductase (1,5-anhydro-D-mannitol-forming)
MIRVAILSFWHVHAAGYARDTKANPDTELVAAWDEDPKRGAQRAAELGIEFIPDLGTLLARKDIDAVIVQTPTSLHREIIIKAAKAGKHVLSDKVLAPTLKEANEIIAATDAAKVVLVTGMSFLYHDYIDRMKQMIESGELGSIVNARMMSCHGGAIRNSLPAGFYSQKEAVGGALVDMCHLVYLTPYLFGMPKGVYANFAYITKREVEDSAFVLCDFDNGAHASIDVGFATKGAPPMEIEINGTEGTVFFRSDTGPNGKGAPVGATFEKRIGDDKTFSPIEVGTPSPIPVVLWSQNILAKTRPDANIDMAIKLSILNEAAYQSAAAGKHVAIASIKG